MENHIKFNNKIYKGQLLWKNNIFGSKDYENKYFINPKEQKEWTLKKLFFDKIKKINNFIELEKSENCYKTNNKNCKLCEKKNISNKIYFIDNYLWDEDIMHYIKYHNIKPHEDFINFIFNFDFKNYFSINLIGRIITDDNINYIKLEKNQIMILDALMKHGGYTKKYYDLKNKAISRYSEHAGFLEISNKIVRDIIVSGNTLRVDKGDEEIYLPGDMPKAKEYYYIFHTHPPTPKPGGRACDGILYEFPSIGDIFHFIDHYNDGNTIGSVVMTPEGLYNIRKKDLNKNKIEIDEDKFYNEIRKTLYHTNNNAIKTFGKKFNTYKFYSTIAQDKEFINSINTTLNKYDLHIDFFPRTKDFKGKWIVDTLFLPIYEK